MLIARFFGCGVYTEPWYILRQAQNEREEELDKNSEGLRMTGKVNRSSIMTQKIPQPDMN